ncbi:MAG: 2,4'-dihydroxyacetophenone dioxygenase family protein [Acidimicrobiia bacterium]
MTAIAAVPSAVHIGRDDLPFADLGEGNLLKVLLVDEPNGCYVVETVFQAGFVVPTHRHSSPVYGYTTTGAWKYQEYDFVNRAGSFLFEPAGSVHTLECLEDDTRVWFQMNGVNMNLDDEGNVVSVTDGAGTLSYYRALCRKQGLPIPEVAII